MRKRRGKQQDKRKGKRDEKDGDARLVQGQGERKVASQNKS